MSDNEEEKVTDNKDDNADQENANNMDEAVYDQENQLLEEGIEADFRCFNPQLKSGHIVYTCKGSDADGVWEGERRYNEFHKLVEKLEQRWPGIPIPQLPPKKAIGNKDLKFINERRYYLERFLKKISAFPFVINSSEFKIFSRPNGDIDKLLKAVPKPNY